MEFRILVYLNDVQIFLLLQYVLATEGFAATCVGSIEEAKSRLYDNEIKAIIIDCSSAVVDETSLSHLKTARFDVAIALVCNQADQHCGNMAADLVLTHPFDPVALIGFLRRVRLDALVERNGAGAGSNILRFADVELNIAGARVRRNGHELQLTSLQFRLLRHLLQCPTTVYSRRELIAAAWPDEVDVEPRTVDIHIGHIRRVLRKWGPDLIRTVRASGYALDTDARE